MMRTKYSLIIIHTMKLSNSLLQSAAKVWGQAVPGDGVIELLQLGRRVEVKLQQMKNEFAVYCLLHLATAV